MVSSPSSHYRPDIDGLRSIAVLLVLFFHAEIGTTGGFVGVDVFFVISGYLITGLILREIEAGTFTLGNFWERRIRRILPAALFSVAICLLVGSVVMLPSDFSDLGKSAVAQLMMAANVFFWRDTGYFAGAAETKVLLHHWSLAVEEQFYVFYPCLLILARRLKRKQIATVLILLAITSFFLSLYFISRRPTATFYLLPFRAWELLAGGLLAMLPAPPKSRKLCELLSVTGLVAILYAAFEYTSSTNFPGTAAILPVLGTCFVILSNTNQLTFAGRLLSLRPVVFVGLISYSLYLWHWPVLAYTRYLMIDLTWVNKILAVAISFVLAALSWRLIEQPIRRKKSSTESHRCAWKTYAWAASFIFGLALCSVTVWQSSGLQSRFDNRMSEIADDASWTGRHLTSSTSHIADRQFPSIGRATADSPEFVIWGDSHALMLCEVIDQHAKQAGTSGVFIAVEGTPPIPNVWRGNYRNRATNSQKIFDYVKQSGCRDLVLVARWTAYLEGYAKGDLSHGSSKQDPKEMLATDGTQPRTRERAKETLLHHMLTMAEECKEKRIRLWIVQQVPEQPGPVAFPWYLRHRLGFNRAIGQTSLTEHLARQSSFQDIADELAKEGIRFVETQSQFFNKDGQPIIFKDGRACYRDNDHLSRYGARVLLNETFAELFSKLSNDPS